MQSLQRTSSESRIVECDRGPGTGKTWLIAPVNAPYPVKQTVVVSPLRAFIEEMTKYCYQEMVDPLFRL